MINMFNDEQMIMSSLIDVYPFHHTAGLFLYALKTSENLGFLMFLRGYRERVVAMDSALVFKYCVNISNLCSAHLW